MEILNTNFHLSRQRLKLSFITDSEVLFVITAHRFQLSEKVIDADNIPIENKMPFLKLVERVE